VGTNPATGFLPSVLLEALQAETLIHCEIKGNSLAIAQTQ
jgi:hypothetical protein